jgi:peptidoglycan/LPS O-acetylase OafA/YrhL
MSVSDETTIASAAGLPVVANARPASGTRVRFAAIDGLRGIACLMVLYFHSWTSASRPSFPSIHLGSRHVGFSEIFSRGYGGVDLFFVLSGFCLSLPILSRPERATNWGKYFIARIRRIVPPYWAALLLFAALSLVARHFNRNLLFWPELQWPGLRGLLVDGMLFWKQILAGPFWTLVLEWRWYFLFPLCIWLCRWARGWSVLLASIPLSALSMWIKYGLDKSYLIDWTEGVFRYLPLFAFGLIAAEIASSGGRNAIERFIVRHARWGMLIWLVLLLLIPIDERRMHLWQGTIHRISLFGILAFFATIAAVHDVRVSRVLAWRPLVWVGSFSYSLYLLHGPLVLGAGRFAASHVQSHALLCAIYCVIIPATMILASYVFYLAFERPFLARKPTVRANTIAPVPITNAIAPPPASLQELAAP